MTSADHRSQETANEEPPPGYFDDVARFSARAAADVAALAPDGVRFGDESCVVRAPARSPQGRALGRAQSLDPGVVTRPFQFGPSSADRRAQLEAGGRAIDAQELIVVQRVGDRGPRAVSGVRASGTP